MEEQEHGEAPQDLAQCNTCKRSFNPKVLEKHAKICQKSAIKRRTTFDSSRQRAAGTGIPVPKPIKPKAEPPKKPSKSRIKREDFFTYLPPTENGGPSPPHPPPTYEDAYIQCPYCQRRFNKHAADRHILFCQELAGRDAYKWKLAVVRKTHTQSKPPAPVKKANSTATSTIPSASSRLPQRSGHGQPTGIPAGKVSSARLVRTNPPGITKPPSVNYAKCGNEGDNRGMPSKFCLSCSAKYPVESAKFCCECGIRRMRF